MPRRSRRHPLLAALLAALPGVAALAASRCAGALPDRWTGGPAERETAMAIARRALAGEPDPLRGARLPGGPTRVWVTLFANGLATRGEASGEPAQAIAAAARSIA